MADIAILVAEEFERRKSSEKKREGQQVNVSSYFSVLFGGVKNHSLMKEEKGKFEVARMILEARSPLGCAAVDGFFSA